MVLCPDLVKTICVTRKSKGTAIFRFECGQIFEEEFLEIH
jgi:hypothetical protein